MNFHDQKEFFIKLMKLYKNVIKFKLTFHFILLLQLNYRNNSISRQPQLIMSYNFNINQQNLA